jgi:hypothetical protein
MASFARETIKAFLNLDKTILDGSYAYEEVNKCMNKRGRGREWKRGGEIANCLAVPYFEFCQQNPVTSERFNKVLSLPIFKKITHKIKKIIKIIKNNKLYRA